MVVGVSGRRGRQGGGNRGAGRGYYIVVEGVDVDAGEGMYRYREMTAQRSIRSKTSVGWTVTVSDNK